MTLEEARQNIGRDVMYKGPGTGFEPGTITGVSLFRAMVQFPGRESPVAIAPNNLTLSTEVTCWLEHIAGAPGVVQLCSRCLTVLRVEGAFPAGMRVKGDGTYFSLVTGWPYPPCEPRERVVGDQLGRPS